MDTSSDKQPVSIRTTLVTKVNFACQQNAVPLIRELAIQNDGAATLTDLTVECSSEPAFIRTKTWRVDRLKPGERVHLSDHDVSLQRGFLWELTEAISGTARFRVLTGETELASVDTAVELLARTEWGGADHMPEMIAAFVTPNDPAVDRLLKEASTVLRRANLPSSLDGYQSGSPQRAGHLIAAIWSAVRARQIYYAKPPASFERSGQKIRTPSHIIEGGLATCLDLTLLLASCLEQAGLHPIIVFTRGHAFVGCWLQDEQFANVVVDDVTSLRKRIQLKEALFFETTLATQRPAPKFTAAIRQARDALAEANDERFELAVDVKRARMQRI